MVKSEMRKQFRAGSPTASIWQILAGNGFDQKVDLIWNEPVSTGSAGAPARPSVRNALNLKLLDAATFRAFEIIAGEGSKAHSINLSLYDHATFSSRLAGSSPAFNM